MEKVKLNEVTWFQEGPGVRNTQYTESGVKLLNVANLVNGKVVLSNTSRFISEDEAFGKYKHFLCDDGDLIIASSGIKVEYLDKKMGFVTKDMLPLCMNTSTIRFKVKDKNQLDIKYLMYFFKSNIFKDQIQKLITGSAQLNYGPSHLNKVFIKMNTMNKQKEIVNKLDKITNMIENQEKMIKKYDDLIKSQFIEMFGDVNTNPKHWEMTKLQNICSSIVRGPFGSALKKEFFVEKNDTTYKVYEQKNAIQKSEKLGTYYITKEKYEELKRFECKPNDFIMSCSGTMGELYQLPASSEKGIINQALCKFTLNGKMNSTVFLEFMKDAIRNIETKGSGIQNIASVIYIKNLDVYVPPIELQNQFADFVKHIDKLKFTLKQTLEKLENCYNSLMQEYFE